MNKMKEIINLSDLELAFERTKQEIASLETIQEAKQYHAKAKALLNYCKSQHKDRKDIQNKLAELKIEAACRGGELLKQMKKRGERKKPEDTLKIGPSFHHERTGKPSLSDLGFTEAKAHRWQLIAALPKEKKEDFKKRELTKEDGEYTEAGLYRHAKAFFREKQEEPLIIPGTYRTIVIDPSWPIEKIERDVRRQQTPSLGYESVPMTIDAIKGTKLPFAKNCHIYLWTTQKFLPIAFEIVEAWEVNYIQTLVWHKNVGFTPFGLFMNNVEFVLFGRRGNLSLLKAGIKAVFNGKVREHSRKPDEFYDLVRKASPEPRIDIFSREKRGGFDQFGNEKAKF